MLRMVLLGLLIPLGVGVLAAMELRLRMAVLSSDIGNRTPKETGVAAKYAQVAV
jgi:hypothetical protein